VELLLVLAGIGLAAHSDASQVAPYSAPRSSREEPAENEIMAFVLDGLFVGFCNAAEH
jgi:hypothetical protein